jgi:hypothetical protein
MKLLTYAVAAYGNTWVSTAEGADHVRRPQYEDVMCWWWYTVYLPLTPPAGLAVLLYRTYPPWHIHPTCHILPPLSTSGPSIIQRPPIFLSRKCSTAYPPPPVVAHGRQLSTVLTSTKIRNQKSEVIGWDWASIVNKSRQHQSAESVLSVLESRSSFCW